jgi:hypothetical protein
VPTSCLDVLLKRKLAQKLGEEVEDLPDSMHVTAQGDSRGDKDRLTWIPRTICHGYYKKPRDGQPAPLPTGSMLRSVLIVHAATHVCLDWICPHTDTWLKDHEFSLEGKQVVRRKGEKVHATLMKGHRELRKKAPHLYKDILVFGQPRAYQDEIICSMLTKVLDEETGGKGAHLLVDMFGGELTPHMEAVNYVLKQPKSLVGPKQTAKTQIIDVFFARFGKVAADKMKVLLRRLMREKAKREGCAAKLEADVRAVMELLNAMHQACLAEAEAGRVVEVMRKTGWFAYELGEKGLVKAEGLKWLNCPVGGQQLPTSWLEHRYEKVKGGVPERPDWMELHRLRASQREDAKTKRDEKQKGAKKSLWASMYDERAPLNTFLRKSTEDAAVVEQAIASWNEKDSSLGFVSEYMPQLDYSEEKDEQEKNEHWISISYDTLHKLDESEGAGSHFWHSLPPKRRRYFLDEASLQKTKSQLPPGDLLSKEEKQAAYPPT